MAARDSPCLVRRVLVRGSVHTYDSVVKQELHSLTTAATLGEVYDGCNVGRSQLRALGVFDSADVHCELSPYASPDGVPLTDVVVHVSLHASTRSSLSQFSHVARVFSRFCHTLPGFFAMPLCVASRHTRHNLILKVVEMKRLASAATGLHTVNGEGQADATLTVRNVRVSHSIHCAPFCHNAPFLSDLSHAMTFWSFLLRCWGALSAGTRTWRRGRSSRARSR